MDRTRFIIGRMDDRLPLPTLLSHALVAFIIEFDNEFEHQAPHRTTNHGSTTGARDVPWLVSMAMWLQCMCFVPEDGIPVRELQALMQADSKSMDTWLTRMGKWWGYILVEPVAAGSRSRRAHPDAIVRPTLGGRKALEVWRPLTSIIEKRWQDRFGKEAIQQLRESLVTIVRQIPAELPDSLPILGYGLFSRTPEQKRPASLDLKRDRASERTLPILLSKVLLAFAIEFERDSEISLAISANILRLFDQQTQSEQGENVRDLPRLAAVSKEAVAMSISFLEKRGYATIQAAASGSRTKMLVQTAKGQHARDAYRPLMHSIEERWQIRFGKAVVPTLRQRLEDFVGQPSVQRSPLFQGLEPYPDGWRASLPKPNGLPHYPMILHRGGFPDGS